MYNILSLTYVGPKFSYIVLFTCFWFINNAANRSNYRSLSIK
jgi:hypothetical protein